MLFRSGEREREKEKERENVMGSESNHGVMYKLALAGDVKEKGGMQRETTEGGM